MLTIFSLNKNFCKFNQVRKLQSFKSTLRYPIAYKANLAMIDIIFASKYEKVKIRVKNVYEH